jgi:ParB family chromosome partitioning protein
MRIIDINLDQLFEAPWNPNQMQPDDLARLKKSLQTYGLVQNLVVRPLDTDRFEVLSGNHRLKILQELKISPVSCVVVNIDDARSRILAQALNHIHGEDDLGLRAEVLRQALETISEEEIRSILPETKGSFDALVSLGQGNIAEYLQTWEKTQSARLKHFQFQLIPTQVAIVEEALAHILPQAYRLRRENPNIRGTALYLLCKFYLEKQKNE